MSKYMDGYSGIANGEGFFLIRFKSNLRKNINLIKWNGHSTILRCRNICEHANHSMWQLVNPKKKQKWKWQTIKHNIQNRVIYERT